MKKTVIAAFAYVILYNLFFYRAPLGVGLGLFFLLLNLYFFFTRNPKGKNMVFAIASSVLSILFAFLFAFRANGVTQFIDVMSALFFAGTAFYFYKQPTLFIPYIPQYLLTPFIALKDVIVSTLSYTNKDKWNIKPVNKEITSALIRGILITVPVIAVLFILLTQADQVFATLTKHAMETVGERLIVSAILFIGLVMIGITTMHEQTASALKEKALAFGKVHELAIITGSIVTLFAVFIIIQFRYLFSNVGEGELRQLGVVSVTYSEYVRKGFFELLIASVIASSVILYVLRYVHRLKEKQKLLIQSLSAILTVETGLLLLSAAKRLSLYADDHGLTRARVYGFIFLVWLGFTLVTYLISLFKDMRPQQKFYTIMIGVLLALLTTNMVNIDGLIATKYKPTVNHEVDYFYLARLSPDAYASWKPAILDAEKTVQQLESAHKLNAEQGRKLYWARETLSFLRMDIGNVINQYGTATEQKFWYEGSLPTELVNSQHQWQAFNLSEYQAYQQVAQDFALYKKVSTLLGAIDSIEQRDRNNFQEVPLDRSSKPPLTR